MGKEGYGEFTLESLLKHPLLKKYSTSEASKKRFQYQLQDPFIRQTEYRELEKVGLKEYLKALLERGSKWEEERQKQQEELELHKTSTQKAQLDKTGKTKTKAEVEDSRMSVITNAEYTELRIILHKPKEGQSPLTQLDIKKNLQQRGITEGIKEEYIRRLAENPIYEQRFKIALGKKAGMGEDGRAVFHFDQEFSPVPKEKEDGSVDYKDINYVQSVKRGTLLCEIFPPSKGEDGFTLDGRILPGKVGASASVQGGKGTTSTANRQKVYALVDGCPTYRDNQIEIGQICQLDYVNNKTGHVQFDGSVTITGDVSPGFTVRATGDIVVGGIVEGELYTEGNVILKSGLKGKRAKIEAGGDICAEFIEGASVLGRKNIQADVILNAEIECWGTLTLKGERGKLIGGHTKIGTSLRANDIGNPANTMTYITLATSDGEAEYATSLKKKIVEAKETIRTIEGLVANTGTAQDAGNQIIVFRLVLAQFQIGAQMARWEAEIEQMQDRNETKRKVYVHKNMHSNVLIEIQKMPFRSTGGKHDGCVVKVKEGSVICTEIYQADME